MTWSVRRASLHDKPALQGLCRVAVGPDDYVLEGLEDLILRSVVHLATDPEGRVVGMASYRPLLDGAAWLGQARTHPDYRRQGVARAIIDSFAGLARTSGVHTLRLWSDASNEEGVAAFSAAGFKEIARFTRVVGAPARGTPKSKPRGFDEDLWRRIDRSPIVGKGRRYASHKWYFLPATRPVVFGLAAKGAFHAFGETVIALADREDGEELWFTMWAGDPSEAIEEACRCAHAMGKARVETFVPHDPGFLLDARRSGFEPGSWGSEAVLAELPVAAANPRRRVRPTYRELNARRAGHGHAHGQSDTLGWARWNG